LKPQAHTAEHSPTVERAIYARLLYSAWWRQG
jgi:hypothetical protein